MSQAEDEISARALEFLNGQHIPDDQFYDAIKGYLQEIPISRVGMPYCPTCESALCGICGQCHEVDHEFLFVGPSCPVAVATHGMSPCVGWSWAYLFLRQAEKALSIGLGSLQKPLTTLPENTCLHTVPYGTVCNILRA